jgi:hypothetical protein
MHRAVSAVGCLNIEDTTSKIRNFIAPMRTELNLRRDPWMNYLGTVKSGKINMHPVIRDNTRTINVCPSRFMVDIKRIKQINVLNKS